MREEGEGTMKTLMNEQNRHFIAAQEWDYQVAKKTKHTHVCLIHPEIMDHAG